jgi:proline dehydrogenase
MEVTMDSFEKRLIRLNGTQAEEYASLVEAQIRKRYSVSAELAILRQRDTKPEEFKAYNDYVEACKAEVKAELEIGGE